MNTPRPDVPPAMLNADDIARVREAIGLSHTVEGYDPNLAVGAFDNIIASHRALQQRLDAAEQRAERYREGIMEIATETYVTYRLIPADTSMPSEYISLPTHHRIIERLEALTEQEHDDD